VCKPVYQIEINSSLVTSGEEIIHNNGDDSNSSNCTGGIKPYHEIKDDLKNRKTLSTSSGGEMMSTGNDGNSLDNKNIDRV